MKKLVLQALAIVAAVAMLAGCSSSADAAAGVVAGENEDPHGGSGSYDYDESDVIQISLGDEIIAASDSVTIEDTTVTITSEGAYEVAGTLTDGQLIVDADDEAVVQIILNDVDITNSDGAAIAVMNAETAVVILAEGSANTLTDGELYVFAEGEDEPNAALFSKADLSVGGTGSLMVVAYYNDGITSKDGLVIDDGTITVDAIDDGIRGKDYVIINGGEIDVTAGGDGIKADNDEDADRGFIDIEDGTIVVASGDDGLQAATDVLMSDGTLEVSAADDAIKGELFVTINGGSILVTDSFEGIEAEVITINDGFIDITANDDGLNVASSDATTVVTPEAVASDEVTEAAPADTTARPEPTGRRDGSSRTSGRRTCR